VAVRENCQEGKTRGYEKVKREVLDTETGPPYQKGKLDFEKTNLRIPSRLLPFVSSGGNERGVA